MDIPYAAEIEALQGGTAIVRALKALFDQASAGGATYRIGGATIRSGTGLPENRVSGNIGDLYLRTDAGAVAQGYAMSVNPATTGLTAPAPLASQQAPTLFTKTRLNESPLGWTTPSAWQHIVNRVDIEASYNDWQPHPARTPLLTNTVVHWTGADGGDADITVTGLERGYQGQLVCIRNSNPVAESYILLKHASTSSKFGNRFTNAVTSGDTPLGSGGYALYEYDESAWTLIAHDQGHWLAPGFVGGTYTGNNSMTWTVELGDVATHLTYLRFKTVTLAVVLNTTTVGGTPSTALQITLPNTWTAKHGVRTSCPASDNGTAVSGMFVTSAGSGTVQIYRDSAAAAWAASTNNTIVQGEITFEVT